MSQVNGGGQRNLLDFVEFDTFGEDVTLLLLDLPKNLVVEGDHGGRGVPSSSGQQRQKGPGFFEVGASTSGIVTTIRLPVLVEDDFAVEFLLAHSVALKFVKREVDTITLNVFTNISQNVRQLHEDAPGLCIFACHGVVVAVHLNAHEANDGSDTVAVNIEFVKGTVAVIVEVVFHARDEVVKHFPRNIVALNGVFQCEEHGVGRVNISVACGEFLAEEEKLGDLVEVGCFVENGTLVLERFKLISIGGGFRVHLAFAAGEPVGPVAVSNVVCTSAEGVNGAHSQTLLLWKVLERMIEVASFSHGQFFAISISEFVKFCGWLLRPNRSIKMGKGINQFVGFAHNADERCTFTECFHGSHAHGLDGVPCEGHTSSESVKGGWRASFCLAFTTRCASLEGEQQVERFAAFQHPNRFALASLVYESSPWKQKKCVKFKIM